MWFFNSNLSLETVLTRLISIAVIVVLILPMHEYAHAKTAYRLGDPTAKNQGRMTINPLKHIDIIGALFMFLFGFGWAKAVPVNARYFKNPKKGMAITALAGPLVNLLAGLVCCFLENLVMYLYYGGMIPYDPAVWLLSFIYFFGVINIGLAIFNLLPIPPLDGSRIVAAFLPDNMVNAYYRYQRILVLIVFVLIYVGVLSVPILAARNAIYDAFMSITGMPFGF